MRATIRNNSYEKAARNINRLPYVTKTRKTDGGLGDGIEVEFTQFYEGQDWKWWYNGSATHTEKGIRWEGLVTVRPESEWRMDDTDCAPVRLKPRILPRLTADELTRAVVEDLGESREQLAFGGGF